MERIKTRHTVGVPLRLAKEHVDGGELIRFLKLYCQDHSLLMYVPTVSTQPAINTAKCCKLGVEK